MITVPFHSEHLKVMNMRRYEAEMVYPFIRQEILDRLASLPANYTVMQDGRILACMGALPMWDGVFEIWQMSSIYLAEYKIPFAKFMHQFIEQTAKQLNAHRFQTTSRDAEPDTDWLTFCGFEKEGVLKAYTRHKEDFIMWGRRFA